MNSFKTLVFDLETKRLADEVGGWDHIDKMGLSAGVTYHVEEDGSAIVDRVVELAVVESE